MFSGHQVVKTLTGCDFVYPGHPLVLATVIMQTYPSFEAANKRTSFGFSEALGNNSVPGAGCHVGAAMHVLKMGAEGSSQEEMVGWAKAYWDEGRAGGHLKNVEGGRAQAVAIEPHFRLMASTWLSAPEGSVSSAPGP